MQARVYSGSRGASQSDVSATHDPLGAHRLRHRVYAGGDGGPAEKANPSQRLALNHRGMAGAVQTALQLPPAPRSRGLARFPATQTIRSIKLYHRQVYAFAYHRPKLEFLRAGMLDDKRAASADSTARFAPLADFLESVPAQCPHELFTREDDPKAGHRKRGPYSRHRRMPSSLAKRTQRQSLLRSSFPQSATTSCATKHCSASCSPTTASRIAVEIPIWLTEADIAAIEREYSIELGSKTGDRAITGHLDFLQVRNGAVHILDYKPDATDEQATRAAHHLRACPRPPHGHSSYSISNARGSMSRSTANSFRVRFSPALGNGGLRDRGKAEAWNEAATAPPSTAGGARPVCARARPRSSRRSSI